MTDRQRLVRELAELEESEWSAMVDAVNDERQALGEDDDLERPENPTRDVFARWVGRVTLAGGWVTEVIYCPGGAPEGEVRLIEVSPRFRGTAEQLLQARNFSVDSDLRGRLSLLVADASPEQWHAIQQGKALLPAGWSLAESEHWAQKKEPRP